MLLKIVFWRKGLIFECYIRKGSQKALCCTRQNYATINILWYYFYYYLKVPVLVPDKALATITRSPTCGGPPPPDKLNIAQYVRLRFVVCVRCEFTKVILCQKLILIFGIKPFWYLYNKFWKTLYFFNIFSSRTQLERYIIFVILDPYHWLWIHITGSSSLT